MSQEPENQSSPPSPPKLPLNLNLRISLMLISLFSSLLLWLTSSFPPIFVGLFLSSFVSLFFYEVLGIVDPEDSLGFDVNFANQGKGVKLTAQLLGSIAVFGLTWVASTWYLDQYLKNPINSNAELDINNKIKNQEYVYLILKSSPKNHTNPVELTDTSDDVKEKYIEIGRLNLIKKLQSVYELDPFDPILVRIRNECSSREGLCTLPQGWFDVEVLNIVNPDLKGNQVSVCKGHGYLAGREINLSKEKSDDSWTLNTISQGIPLNQESTKVINKNTPIQVSIDVDRFCPSSTSLYPRFRVSPELQPLLENMLQDSQKVYARTLQG